MSGQMADPRSRRRAALGSAVFLVAGPGVVTGLVPWLMTRWKVRPVPGGTVARVLGGGLIAAGGSVLTHSFVRFVVEGIGTPVPAAPPRHLVVGGIYRHVRNPMYVALEAVIIGEALVLGQRRLLGYAAIFVLPSATFVRFYEEPKLARSFGAEYEEYRRNVPGWFPRLRPWRQ